MSTRCLTCGRRWAGVHDGCAPTPSLPVSPPQVPAAEVPGYVIDSVIGQGGFGLVLGATSKASGARVAIKLAGRTPAIGIERLLAEAGALRAIGGPDVPRVFDDGPITDGHYLALELVQKPLLAHRLERLEAGVDLATFRQLAFGLTHAVAAVHAHGYAHCDLKPENIFIDDSGAATLIDFGIVRMLGTRNAAGDAAGTSEYMAPEQCVSGAVVDQRADIYALGVLFYELLTGRVPFIGTSGRVIEMAHLARRPPRPSQFARVSEELERVVLRCLAKQPSERFGEVAQLEVALEASLQHASGGVTAVTAPRAAARAARATQPALGLLFVTSTADVAQLTHALTSMGADLASVQGARWIAAFTHAASENPVTRALHAAELLVAQHLCAAPLVHLARVNVSERRGGGKRYMSPLFSSSALFALPEDAGVLVTREALGSLGSAAMGVELVRENVLRLSSRAPEEATTFGRAVSAMFGRDGELEAQVKLFEQVEQLRVPGLSVVLGETGLGKSLFSAELARHLRATKPRADVAHLRARPSHDASNETFRALVCRAAGLTEDDAGRRVLLASALEVDVGADAELAVSAVLGWLGPDAPELVRLAAAPGVLVELAVRTMGDLLRRRARQHPFALVLDDAHLADRATLDLLHYVTLPEGGAQVWVCVVAQPVLSVARQAWCASARSLERLALPDACALVRTLLLPAERVPQASVELLVQRAAGIPLLLVELIGALKREGLLRRQGEGGRTWYLASEELDKLPDIPVIQWSAERDLKTLSEDLAAHAQLAAVLGGSVRVRDVAGVLGELDAAGVGERFPLDAQVALTRLESARVLVRHRDERYDFRTGVLRDAVMATATDVAADIHAAAVRFYRQAPMPDAERWLRLSEHAAAIGLRDEAGVLFIKLADGARLRHDYFAAERAYSRALENLPEARLSERLAAQRYRGQMRYRTGRYEGAVVDLQEAAAKAAVASDVKAQAEAMLIESTTQDWMGDFLRSRALNEQAAPLVAALDAPLLTCELALGRGRSHWRFSEYPQAHAALEQAVTLASTLGEPAYEPHIDALVCLGPVLVQAGDRVAARATFEAAIALAERHQDKLHQGSAVQNRLLLWLLEHDGERALADTSQFLKIVRELGVTEGELRTEYNLAELTFQLEQLDAAERHVSRAIELAEQLNVNTSTFRSMALLLRARIFMYRDDLAGARRIVEDLRADAQKSTGKRTLPIEADEMYAHVIELATSSEPDEEGWHAMKVLSTRVGLTQDPLEVAEAHARYELRQGRRDRGRALFQGALDDGDKYPNIMLGRLRRQLDAC